MTALNPASAAQRALSRPLSTMASVMRRPLASFHLIVALTVVLTVFGLVMVLSASAVEDYSHNGSAYSKFTTQMVFAILGAALFYLALRVPVRWIRRIAAPAMIVTTLMLAAILVPGIGTLSGGARRWFSVAGFSIQPSELVKVALAVWGSHLLASRLRERARLRDLLVPLVPVALMVCLLIILEPNLSTTITIAVIVGTQLWFAGLSLKVFAGFAITAASTAILLALVAGYRSQRVFTFLGDSNDPLGTGYQARQARFALGSGWLFGSGLGQGQAKWNYLPNAHNDFIFAVIGEELGLVGAITVIVLFVLLGYVGFRIALRSVDPFVRMMTATITVLISVQALINIGYVVNLLPVTGIQLPLISAGGTSTLSVLVMMGLIGNAARHEPDAVAALSVSSRGKRSRLGSLGAIFALPKPESYIPPRVQTWRERRDKSVPVAAGPRTSPHRERSRGSAPHARMSSARTQPPSGWRGSGNSSKIGMDGRARVQTQRGMRGRPQPVRASQTTWAHSAGDGRDWRTAHSRGWR